MASPLLKLEVSPDGAESYDVDVNMRTVVAWEKQFLSRSMAQLFGAGLKATYLSELAYVHAFKAGKTTGSFAEFSEATDVALLKNEDAVTPDPTLPAVSAAP